MTNVQKKVKRQKRREFFQKVEAIYILILVLMGFIWSIEIGITFMYNLFFK